jgi:hypothetical protein
MGYPEVMLRKQTVQLRGPEVGFAEITVDLLEARFPVPIK